MLFGSVDYDHTTDLWALGLIFGEMLSPTLEPLFPGRSDIEQLCLIFRVVRASGELSLTEHMLMGP